VTQLSAEQIKEINDEYVKHPENFTDIGDFTNSLEQEIDQDNIEYEENLTHNTSSSTCERIQGNSASSILLKWHIISGHINRYYLLRFAKTSKEWKKLQDWILVLHYLFVILAIEANLQVRSFLVFRSTDGNKNSIGCTLTYQHTKYNLLKEQNMC